MKQKIQDNLLVLEKDCTVILAKTESQLHQSIRCNARLTRLRRFRNWTIFLWLLGLLLLGVYVAMQFVDEHEAALDGSNSVLSKLRWMKLQSEGLLPPFSVLAVVKWTGSLCAIHGGVLLVIHLLMGCWKVPSKEKLGQLQSNRKGLKAMMCYREELYNQYIKFWDVCGIMMIMIERSSFHYCCVWDCVDCLFGFQWIAKCCSLLLLLFRT